MNAAIENMLTRRSCRDFKPDMPPRQLLDEVCKAGTYAPTGHGKQSPIIVAVTNRALRDQLSKLNAEVWAADGKHSADFDPFYGAPAVLVVLANTASPTAVYDGCCVMANLMLAAHSVGLASCWIHRAKEVFSMPVGKKILADLGIEGNYVGVGHCAIGYAASEPRAALPRKADYVHWVE